jgi:fatty acid amide hydrolase 2
MPAFFNGVFGHKPTGGLVPFTGQYPPAEGAVQRYVTTGPLARRAADLMPILRAVAGPDGVDAGSRRVTLGDPADVDLSSLRVLDVPDNGFTPVSADLRRAQAQVVRWLGDQGAQVVPLTVGPGQLEGLKSSLPIWSSMLSASEGSSYAELLANGGRFNLPWELLRSAWGGSPYTIPSLGLALLELVPKLLPSGQEQYVRQGEQLKAELVERLGPGGVMIFPPYATPAPRHVKPLLPPWHWVYTAIINVMELPSTQVPLGLNADGLPLGVQVVGLHDQDHVTIAVAEALEKAFGGWVMPPL